MTDDNFSYLSWIAAFLCLVIFLTALPSVFVFIGELGLA